VKTKILLIVTSDPRTSPRPAEAVRIAAGVGAWEKVEVTLCLCAAAVLALGESAEDLVDGEHFTRYLPLVAESGRTVYAQQDAPLLKDLGEAPFAFHPIDNTRLAELASASRYVLRF